MRLLFVSIHSYLDAASGAALGTRELFELRAARGMGGRVLTVGVLDAERDRSNATRETQTVKGRSPSTRRPRGTGCAASGNGELGSPVEAG